MKSYLISRIDYTNHAHTEAIEKLVQIDCFVPHKNAPCDIPHDKYSSRVFDLDYNEMMSADVAVVAFPIGSDCAAEIGWFSGNGKPVLGIIYETGYGESCEMQYHTLKDNWIVKGFLTNVLVIGNRQVFEEMLDDPILGDKVFLAEHSTEVRRVLMNFVRQCA